MTEPKIPPIKQRRINLWGGILWRDLGPWISELISVSFFINLLALATPLFVLQVYDRVVFKASLTTLQGLVIGMAIVVCFDFILKITRARFFQSVAAKNDYLLSEQLFSKLFRLPLRILEEKNFWHWQSLFQDAQLVRNVLSGSIAALIIDLPFSILFFLVIIMIAPPLWWIIILAMIFFILLALVSQVVIRKRSESEHQNLHDNEKLLADLIKNRESVSQMALYDFWHATWTRSKQQGIESSIYRGRAVDTFRTLSQSMMVVFTVTLTSFGALAILQQEMTIGTLIAANMLGSRLIQPFVQLVEQWKVILQAKQAIKRLNQFINLSQNKVETATEIPTGPGKISFQQLRFSYTSQENTDANIPPAIDGLNGHIGPGGLHLLMGKNGSGKSSLLKLIASIYPPAEGEILLDGADLRQLTPTQLQKRFGYLPQRLEMFQTSIFENIRIGCLDCNQEDIIAMANKTGLHEQVIQLPNGYDTQINDDNRGLSGGLIQRIAITRALLGEPQIILMDEPTNNLDQIGEQQLIELLKEMSSRHTILVTSHRQRFMSYADSIVLLEQGRVAIAGPAKAVIQHLTEREQSSEGNAS